GENGWADEQSGCIAAGGVALAACYAAEAGFLADFYIAHNLVELLLIALRSLRSLHIELRATNYVLRSLFQFIENLVIVFGVNEQSGRLGAFFAFVRKHGVERALNSEIEVRHVVENDVR